MRQVEQLETRRLLADFTASSVAELVAGINAANASGGSNTITLAAGTTFRLSAVDNITQGAGGIDRGPTGLPVVAAGNDLTIVGNGDTIQRSSGKGTPAFRLFAVAAGGSLTLNDLTLSGGLLAGFAPRGAAIFNEGTLGLTGVTTQNCTAQGLFGSGAAGGAIFSDGVLAIANSAIRNNQALGSDGDEGQPDLFGPGPGAPALGGGLYVAGGTATVSDTTFSSNLARGGDGGNGFKSSLGFLGTAWVAGGSGGDGRGGAIYAAAGSVTLRRTTITQNAAQGGTAGTTSPKAAFPYPANGAGQGGGLYIGPAASASMDAFTYANIRNNSASTSGDDIFGSFAILS